MRRSRSALWPRHPLSNEPQREEASTANNDKPRKTVGISDRVQKENIAGHKDQQQTETQESNGPR